MDSICFTCRQPKKLTSEHIIPQSLGGRRKAKLYCKECNDFFGREIDNEIAKQFGPLATILKIKRDRGKPQSVELEEAKNKDRLSFDGYTLTRKDPIVEITIDDNGKTLKSADIRARSKKELMEIIKSLQVKYELPHDFQIFEEDRRGPTDLNLSTQPGNKLIKRAIAKMAYNLLCIKAPTTYVLSPPLDDIRSYIQSGYGNDMACANFINTQFMTDYTRPLHKIHVSFNRDDKIVVGYVSLFGMFRFTILLSYSFASELEWADLDYTFDPVRRQEVFGNDRFRAPLITTLDVLHPKQSKSFVQDELNRGEKIIENYVPGFKFLSSELI